jgi:hypothetical protein
MSQADLLPSNSTLFERAFAATAPRPILEGEIDRLHDLRSTPPEQFIPWVLSEYGIADLAVYFDGYAEALASGRQWLLVRGLPAAVKIALSWIGFPTPVLEEDGGWRVHVDPGSASAVENLAALAHLFNRSVYEHVQLYRVYHQYDVRHLVLDRSHLDDSMLDDDSGITVDGIKLSFGTRHAAVINLDAPINAFGLFTTYSARIYDDNSWRLDAYSLDSEVMIDAAGRMISQVSQFIGEEPDQIISTLVSQNYADGAVVAIDLPTVATRFDAMATQTDDLRRWSGPWTGPWRDIVYSHFTQEVV